MVECTRPALRDGYCPRHHPSYVSPNFRKQLERAAVPGFDDAYFAWRATRPVGATVGDAFEAGFRAARAMAAKAEGR